MDEILTETTETNETTEATAWDTGVAEEYKSAMSGFVQDGKLNIPEVCKGYSELFTKMGSYTKMLTDESTTEEKSAFYKQQGRPDTAEGYTKPTLAEGEEVNQEFFSGMATVAHESGLSGTQFDKMVGRYLDFEAQVKEAQVVEFNRYREESDRKLHEDLGADYDRDIELSKRAYTEYANDELKELFDPRDADGKELPSKWRGILNEPPFIKMMVEIGKKNMDDTFVKGEGQIEKPKDNFAPNSPSSPEMYATMEGEEGVKSRAYFRVKGHVYERKD